MFRFLIVIYLHLESVGNVGRHVVLEELFRYQHALRTMTNLEQNTCSINASTKRLK